MKTFLIIQMTAGEYEHDDEERHIVSGETFEEALKQTYLHESIEEWVVNLNPGDPWPTNVVKDLGECYQPRMEVYQIEKVLDNKEVKESLDTYLNGVLAKAVEEEKVYQAEAPKREKEAKMEALQKAAAELGMDLKPKKKKAAKKKA